MELEGGYKEAARESRGDWEQQEGLGAAGRDAQDIRTLRWQELRGALLLLWTSNLQPSLGGRGAGLELRRIAGSCVGRFQILLDNRHSLELPPQRR